jgi:hypothetical protein
MGPKSLVDRSVCVSRRRPSVRKGISVAPFHRTSLLMIALAVSVVAVIVLAGPLHSWEDVADTGPGACRMGSLTAHAPIYINGNSQFASQALSEGWQGDGSPGNPYIIEGYDIDARVVAGVYCIHIESTSVHFVIRDCHLFNASYVYGEAAAVRFYHLSHGAVENCSAERSGRWGYLASDCQYVSLTNCTSHIAPAGVYFNGCEHSSATGCRFDNTGALGQSFYKYGISIYASTNITAANNTIRDYADIGLTVSSSSGLLFRGNSVNGSEFGISLYISHSSIICNNTLMNSSTGVQAISSRYNIFSGNRIENSTGYGMRLSGTSTGNRIWGNQFLFNNGLGKQACDESGTNFWNATGSGNYWSDWTGPDVVPPYGIVDIPYTLAGTTGACDNYPLTSHPTQIPEFGGSFFVVAGSAAVFLLVAVAARGRLRRRPP